MGARARATEIIIAVIVFRTRAIVWVRKIRRNPFPESKLGIVPPYNGIGATILRRVGNSIIIIIIFDTVLLLFANAVVDVQRSRRTLQFADRVARKNASFGQNAGSVLIWKLLIGTESYADFDETPVRTTR